MSQGSSVDNNGGMGLSVSTLYNAEIEKELNVNDEDKTLFDWCKEGNANKLKKILKQRKNGVMEKDDHVCFKSNGNLAKNVFLSS